jgi:hypothetical protein
MFVFVFGCCLSCVGRDLCDELITRPEEVYYMSNRIQKPKKGGQGPAWAIKATDDDDDD